MTRYFEYKADKSLLFMLDLCYYVNISTILQLLVDRDNVTWFLGNYALCLGVLMNAMVVWQNCFILHNISKMTSCFLHAFAPFTLHLVRWKIIPNNLDLPEDGINLSDIFILPMMMYFVWQLFYLFVTEVVLASWIRDNKDQLFAIRLEQFLKYLNKIWVDVFKVQPIIKNKSKYHLTVDGSSQ